MIFGVELDMPAPEQENGNKFSRALPNSRQRANTEVSWAKSSSEQRKMAAAKNLEVEAWLTRKRGC